MNFLRSRRGIGVLAAVLVVLFLFRPGVYRLRHRITGSIGSALGRRVEIDNVRVHVLPRPGFDLEGLVIYDDPAFSPEPMVRAQDVSARIRLRSLLRGRLEIARLSATEPSINLVRNREGRWNLSNLLERNALIPVAPTGKAPSEHRPAFPYLEATHARINFKIEQEKKPYALTDGDVALWQESENSWGARMRAQPVRTDFNLTDTGLLELNATWQRAADLHATPVQVSVQWEKGQLGQITKLLSGKDRGWRGGVTLSANLSGTPEALLIRSQVGIADFHRYDIAGNGAVLLSANCAGRYSVADGTVKDLLCESPLASGTLKMSGKLGPVGDEMNYDLKLAADKVPLTSVLRVLRQAKKQLSPDLTATGLVRLNVHAVHHGLGPGSVDGDGAATSVRLIKNGGQDEIVFGNIPLTFVTETVAPAKSATVNARVQQPKPQMRVGPFPLALGGPAPASAGGWISASGYGFMVTGDAALRNLFRLADTVGIGGARPAAEGFANISLNVSGSWQGFSAPVVSGTAQLRNVRAEMRGVSTPIEITATKVVLTPDVVSLEKVAAQTGTTHWDGKVVAARNCAPGDCTIRFDLTADRLSSTELQDWFASPTIKRPWYRILNLGEQTGPSPLLSARASGTLRVGRFEIKKLSGTQVTTQVELDHGKISLSNLRGQVLQGIHEGNWTIDVSAQPFKYAATGTLQDISLAQVSALMNDAWVKGRGDAKFEGTTSGITLGDLLTNASATLHFSMRDGNLPRIANAISSGPFSVHKLSGDLRLDKGTWELSAARLESHDGIYQVSGRASAKSGLNFTLLRNDDRSWTLFGTLAKPRLERTSRTQAQATVPSKP